jgi:hypothetical protein
MDKLGSFQRLFGSIDRPRTPLPLSFPRRFLLLAGAVAFLLFVRGALCFIVVLSRNRSLFRRSFFFWRRLCRSGPVFPNVSFAKPGWNRLIFEPQASKAAFIDGAAMARSKNPVMFGRF